MQKIKIKHAAEMLGVTQQAVRIGLQRNIFDFGAAYKTKDNNKQYHYILYPEVLKNKVGEQRYQEVLKNEN